jgi:hypothetical protein
MDQHDWWGFMRVTKFSVFLVAAMMLVLGGCEETGRLLSNDDKGTYAGKSDTALTSEQVNALRHRGNYQKD